MKINASASSSAAVSPCRAVGLVCEFLTNPLGLETKTPRLSWRLEDSRLDAKQTAYRLVASSSADKLAAETYDLWDTGRTDSAETLDIVYAGKKLKSRSAAFWRVMVWDKDGAASAWSDAATFEIGLFGKGDGFYFSEGKYIPITWEKKDEYIEATKKGGHGDAVKKIADIIDSVCKK